MRTCCPICKLNNCEEFNNGWSFGFSPVPEYISQLELTKKSLCWKKGKERGLMNIDSTSDEAYDSYYGQN